ncbi:MAG: hypothetical protein P8J32_08250 [bacterium]|nr:hypothetical protein [bacterium]
MEKISKGNLANLLNDLYEIFNPDYKQYVEGLSQKYLDMPLESVDMILFKYNQPHMTFHDPQMNSTEYQMKLVSEYAKGLRSLQELDISKRRAELQAAEESASKQVLEAQKQKEAKLKEELMTQTGKIKESTSQEIQSVKKEMEKVLEEIKQIRDEARKNPEDDGAEYHITVNYTKEEVVLPNAKRLAGLGIGARVIAKSTEGRPVGLIVKDITYDDISHPMDKTIIDVILDKG